MGLLDQLGIKNGFGDFIGDHRNAIIGLGTGLANGTNFSQGLGLAAQGIGQGNPADVQASEAKKTEQQRLAQINKTAMFLHAKGRDDLIPLLDAGQGNFALQQAFAPPKDPVDPTSTYQGRIEVGKQQGLTGVDLQTFALTGKLPGGNQTARAGVGASQPYRNKKTGELIGIQPMTVGPGVNTITGEPVTNPDDYEPAPYDLAAQRAGGTTDATNAAIARNALPGVEQAYAVTKKALAQLSSDPSVMSGQQENFGNVLGIPQQMLPILPKTNRANFQNVIDQLSGNAFLNIRQALKGAGQVTDFEGQKGEDAISRMKKAAERGDSDAFNQAVSDFNEALDNGVKLLRDQAGGSYAAGNVPSLPVPQGGNTTSTGIPWSFTP